MAYTQQPAGRLQRLSVAVLIDNLRTTDADDKVTETPLTEEQLARITTLVRDAVGFDEARGDRVSVVNQSFLPETVAGGRRRGIHPVVGTSDGARPSPSWARDCWCCCCCC